MPFRDLSIFEIDLAGLGASVSLQDTAWEQELRLKEPKPSNATTDLGSILFHDTEWPHRSKQRFDVQQDVRFP